MRLVVDCRQVTSDPDDPVSTSARGITAALGALHPITMLIHRRRQLEYLPDLPWQLLRPADDPRDILSPAGLNDVGVDLVYSPLPVWSSAGRRYALVVGCGRASRMPKDDRPPLSGRLLRPLARLFSGFLRRRADAAVAIAGTDEGTRRPRAVGGRPVTALEVADSVRRTDAGGYQDAADQLLALFYALHQASATNARPPA